MIEVNHIYIDDTIRGFEISGHANFDEYGYDIVCAAVSMLAYTTINSLDNYGYELDFSDDEDIMKLMVLNPSYESEIILNTFNIGIFTLEQSYKDFVRAYSTTNEET